MQRFLMPLLLMCCASASWAVATMEQEQIEQQRPQGKPLRYELPPIDPLQVPPPAPLLPRESLPVPDRWRIKEALGIKQNWRDPYNQNVYKGDKPFKPFAQWGPDWFLNVGVISDSLLEARRLPTPVGPQATHRPGSLDVFGQGRQSTLNQNVILSASVIKGDTTFRPPDYEFRIVSVLNVNRSQVEEVRALSIDPRKDRTRDDHHFAVQEAFADIHLRNVSDRYDFDSLRVGVQPFISDFRGFVFQDNALGIRLFGNRDNNLWQYNLGWFRRIEKDTNSGLNDFSKSLREDDVFVADVFRQDFPVAGHTTQLIVMHNRNHEAAPNFYNNNGFLERPAAIGDERPHNYRVTYVGVNGDGHFGRWNLTSSLYGVFGRDTHNPFSQRPADIEAGFGAAELSRDFDWIRVRGTAVYASGDKNPFDNKNNGFDAILENPQIAGADTSFWIRQAVPLVGGGGVTLSGRNGLLPSLRSSKDQGQSNFINPGLTLFGLGADVDVTPQLRVVANLSKLDFVNTAVLSVLRNQAIVSKDIGVDVSAGMQYRPFASQNIVFNASAAALLPGKAMKQLYDEHLRGPQYSVLLNLLLTY